MNKYFLATVFSVVFFSFSASTADAALLTLTDKGELYWNVLGLTDEIEKSALEIKKIADNINPNKIESVALINESGKIFVRFGDEEDKVDVTEYSEDIVEIEQTDSPSKVFIEATQSGFAIKQRGITAETSFPIKIDSTENKVTVETPTGTKLLSTLPYEAVRLLTNSNLISEVPNGEVNIIEKEQGEITYEVNGKKYITLFKILSFEVPIKAEVSATSGNVVNLDQPVWYALVGYFLS